MPQNDRRFLCVSIHDVAPPTWPDCLRLLGAVRAVADIPVTWLVVPCYHASEADCDSGENSDEQNSYERALRDLLAQGHELALHGYTHLDAEMARGGLRGRFVRDIYTRGEGEFAAIDAKEAMRRLELGLAWFGRRNWPVKGFVAPAWLLSDGAWEALRKSPFEYTTTMRRFHLLPQRQSVFSPSLVYTARNAIGRSLSKRWSGLLASLLRTAPLVRLSLHPRDAAYPELVRHFQHLLEDLLASRDAITKASFAQLWRESHRDENALPRADAGAV
jgi:hypothetical protein